MWVDTIQAVFACTARARWRKAAKCKSLTKQVQSHLTILRNRKESIIRQSRADIAQFLQDGLLQRALERIEQFCGCIISNISQITRQSSWHTLPVDTIEAVSSLVFAASRCGELPELQLLRSLFKKRYGCEFELSNVELQPGNLVNFQIKENLCINSIPDNMKQKLINEIAKDYGRPLVFQDPKVNEKCCSEEKAEVLDLELQDISSDIDENSEYVMQRKDISHCKPLARIPNQSRLDSNGYYSSTQIEKNADFVNKQEVSSTRTSLDSFTPQIYETVYLDDLEVKQNGSCENYVATNSTLRHSTRKFISRETICQNPSMEDPLRRKNCKLVNGHLS
ncbi:hypothetical protein REPUB_Repub05bG0058000 [Reevesia pubescens]